MTATVSQLPAAGSMTARVAAEVRAELGRQRIAISHLPQLAGGSYSYWNRRVNGVTPLDVDDLERLGHALGREVADFIPPRQSDRPGGPDGPDRWAPSGSNRRPTDYESDASRREAVILSFPAARPRHLPIAS